MKKFLVSVVLCVVVCLAGISSFAKEMAIGERRSIDVDSQKITVYFKELSDRICLVDIVVTKDGKEIFSENLSFDKIREERQLPIGGKEVLIFYIVKGLVITIDEEEV